jgi:Spy/CpxP family protein refolding chaperone
MERRRKSMRVTVLAGIGILAVAGSVVVAAAQERPRGTGVRPDRAALPAELGLSAEQTAQIQKLRVEGRKQAIRLHADLAIARMELAEAVDGPTVDEKMVAAKVKAVSDLQAAALKARTDERLAMRRILTPEQQEKMKQLTQRNRQERGPRAGGAWRQRQPGRWEAPPPPGPGGPALSEPGR